MSADKKYWYVVSGEIQEVNADLARKGVFHIWGLQKKLEFEAQPGVLPLPHALSRKPVHPQAMKFLNDCMAGAAQENAIAQGDGMREIVDKLTAHTGWHGWWPHL